MPKFVKSEQITMFHESEEPETKGWKVGFQIRYPRNRKPVVNVWVISPTGRTIRDIKRVSQILPVEDWPEFARNALDQKVKESISERLF